MTLGAAASDDGRVAAVDFLVDGNVVATDSTSPFSATWNSQSVVNGAHTLRARAVDDAGNTASSSDVSITVENSAPPTVSVTAPAAGANVTGTASLTANASDDVSVTKVEFLVDGLTVAEPDTVAPYGVSWNTLDSANPFYDGTHEVTARAWDGHGNTTTSTVVSVNVTNTAASKFRAKITPSTVVPQAMTYDPAKVTQDTHYTDLSITNTSGLTWAAGDVVARFRWLRPDGTGSFVSGDYAFASDVVPGATRTIRVGMYPPTLPAGVDKAEYKVRFDLYSKTSAAWFADKGNPPSDHPVLVNKAIEATALGLERYYHYMGEGIGAGMSHLVNVASGNSLLRWSPFFSPGRGLSTSVDLTYNSLEDKSDSPVGNNFSLGISSLTRFGLPLDIHPNNADTIAGRSNKYVEFTDADGTTHRFTGNAAGGWDEPEGVHLWLRQYSTTDPQRKWALTRPDRVTYFFDDGGFPTSVQDKNGNRIEFAWENVPPGEDPGGTKRRITTITDAAGLGATPAPNRKFTIDYYSKPEAKKPQIRGKIERITDHDGSALLFDYYDDGNLLRLTQKGGTNADGSFLPDRTFVFTYTTPDGSGPAIPIAADRVNPAAKTAQSTRLYSVRDPRGNETTFAYHGPTTSQLRWKLLSRTNRKGDTTSYGYDLVNRVTTVTEPLSRVTKFGYDTQGKVTAITDPMNRLTQVAWTTDRHVRRVTEPTGRFVEFAYNDNGYLTDRWDQLRNHTHLEYQNLQVPDSAGLGDSRDSSTYWKAGRTIPHLSQLISKTEPKGMATTAAADFEWTFGYDGSGNLTSVVQPGPEDFTTNYAYNADGTISKVTHPPTHTTTGPVRAETTFPSYDANGFPTRIQDPAGTTTLEFDADGLLRWVQDPLHASSTGGAPENYRTFFYYDSFHRLGAQSTPKSTRFAPGELMWSGLEYDPNDNVIVQRTPSNTRGGGNRVAVVYDAMDRQVELSGPDTADGKTTLVWDPASRLDKVLLPKSSTVPGDQDHTIFYSYDLLDRVIRQTRHETTADTGAIIKSLHTHYCYDPAGDLVSITAPNAGLATINCATPPSFTSKRVYDNAHRLTIERDPIGNETRYGYDANGNVRTVTDPRGRIQTVEYDQRDLMEKVTQPFDQTRVPARDVVAKMQYDGAGNLTRSISPRAWDKSSDKVTFTEFVTEYRYDLANRLVRTDLPTSAAKPEQHFLHYRYDANGNLESTSLPVLSATSAPSEATTVMDYWDPGWIRTSRDATKKVLYDYTPEGWQSVRTPFTTPAGSELDLERRVSWSYYPDGMLREVVERDEGRSLYLYDEHNNLKKLDDSSGVKAPAESPFDIRVTYDTLDRLKTVKDRKANEGPDDFRLSTYGYDLNGNVVDREDNALVKPTGTTPGRKHRFVYDEADWIRTQWDYGDEAGCADDQKITNDFFPTGWERERLIEKNDAACVLGKKQKTTWDYFDNGKLKVLKTFSWKDDPATADTTRVETLQESHTVSYEDGSGIYVNGHRTSGQFTLQGTNSGRCSTAPGCTARFFYDPRDRIERHEDGRGTATIYDLSTSGNILKETVTSPTGTKVTDYTYNGDQLATVTAGSSPTQRYYYDTLGRLDCIVLEGATQSVCNQDASQVSPKVLAEYRFDDLDRLTEYSSYTTNGTTSSLDDTASYVYDALDRLVTETEGHGGSATKTTTAFTYQGLSRLATKEARTRSGSLVDTKTFSYDAVGNRISMNHSQPGAAVERFTYAYDVHGSTSLLIRDSGAVKAAYAYRPYGELDTSLAAGDTNPDDSFNPYRYSGHRYDSGSGSIDMGARRFSPGANRFLSPDMYLGALSDLGLSLDPLTGNRYGLAAGNPVSFVEVDGHMLAKGPGVVACGSPADLRLSWRFQVSSYCTPLVDPEPMPESRPHLPRGVS
ncbi:MAG: Ig-like domain-containing protein [Actinomycetota bacterium]|nr:Ig-like domain-containing protein [Actinomycetota bacterium]